MFIWRLKFRTKPWVQFFWKKSFLSPALRTQSSHWILCQATTSWEILWVWSYNLKFNTLSSSRQDSAFEPFNYIGSQDTKQYLYRLLNRGSTSPLSNTKDDVDDAQLPNLGQSPSSSPYHLQVNKGITNMGKLDIMWKSCMGEKGRLQTSQLQKVTHGSGDMRVTVVEAPGEVTVGKMYSIVVCITNCWLVPMRLT